MVTPMAEMFHGPGGPGHGRLAAVDGAADQRSMAPADPVMVGYRRRDGRQWNSSMAPADPVMVG